MRAKRICFFVACLLMLGCQKKSDLTADISGNPVRKSNKFFKSYEDLGSPKFAALREKYKIDTAFHGEQDDHELRSSFCGLIVIFKDTQPLLGIGVVDLVNNILRKFKSLIRDVHQVT